MTDTLTHNLATIDLNSSMTVKNVAPSGHKFAVLTLSYGPKSVYQIASGEQRQVPFAVVKMALGDVRSSADAQVTEAHTDMGMQKSVIPPRKFEVNRLHVFYGLHLTQEDTFEDVADRVPQVELYFDGMRIPTVIEDPLGKSVVVAHQTVTENESLRAELAELRQMFNEMKDGSGGTKITSIRSKSTRVVTPSPEESDNDTQDNDDFVGNLPTDDVDD